MYIYIYIYLCIHIFIYIYINIIAIKGTYPLCGRAFENDGSLLLVLFSLREAKRILSEEWGGAGGWRKETRGCRLKNRT